MTAQAKAAIEITVPFYDIDPMNIVWHGHYIKYFELARCEVLAEIGYGYREMKESGYSWPVVDLHARYLRSATLGQKILCSATIVEYENRLKIAYEITAVDTGERLTKGSSIQVAIEMATGELQLVSPSILLEKLGGENHEVS